MNGPLHPDSWHYRELNARNPGLDVLSRVLLDLVERGHPVVAATADLQYSNGLVRFAKARPDRFVQFGISEQNMVSAAAGMAAAGMIPVAATFASFLALLCCEQIRTDLAYSNLPVRLVGHHAGIVLGFYGTSHHATEDLAIMRSIANLAVVAPADGPQLAAALTATIGHPGPIYFRIGRGREPDVYGADVRFELGKAVEHRKGERLGVIACGSMLHPTLEASAILAREGIRIGVVDMPTIKPLDEMSVAAMARHYDALLTVEEHSVLGGLGGAVAEVIAGLGRAPRLKRHGIMDEYAPIAPPTDLYRHYRLDAEGIAQVAREVLAATDEQT